MEDCEDGGDGDGSEVDEAVSEEEKAQSNGLGHEGNGESRFIPLLGRFG